MKAYGPNVYDPNLSDGYKLESFEVLFCKSPSVLFKRPVCELKLSKKYTAILWN